MTLQQSKNTLSENVKKHRTAVSMSTEALSNICGVNQRTIQDIESGVANPQFETIYKIADTLGIPLFELLIPRVQMRCLQSSVGLHPQFVPLSGTAPLIGICSGGFAVVCHMKLLLDAVYAQTTPSAPAQSRKYGCQGWYCL